MGKHKKSFDVEHILEIVVVVMLGITALCTAWASWIGSLHGGNQATSYTVSNNLTAEGNAEYNAAVQSMNQDMILWNEVSDLQFEILFEQDLGTVSEKMELAGYKLFCKLNDNLSEEMAAQIGWDFPETDDPTAAVLSWMEKEEALVSPFADQEFADHYFAGANELLGMASQELESGKKSNADGDAFGLVTVIYSVVLFLLGIAGSFKGTGNKNFIIIISLVGFVVATVYMFTIPLPDGFTISSFFAKG